MALTSLTSPRLKATSHQPGAGDALVNLVGHLHAVSTILRHDDNRNTVI
jgi:hypothetical protein